MDDISVWRDFSSHCRRVLALFETHDFSEEELQQAHGVHNSGETKSGNGGGNIEGETGVGYSGSKYLTSSQVCLEIHCLHIAVSLRLSLFFCLSDVYIWVFPLSQSNSFIISSTSCLRCNCGTLRCGSRSPCRFSTLSTTSGTFLHPSQTLFVLLFVTLGTVLTCTNFSSVLSISLLFSLTLCFFYFFLRFISSDARTVRWRQWSLFRRCPRT